MPTIEVTFHNPETDTVVVANVFPEYSARANNDIVFATQLMNTLMNQQQPACIMNNSSNDSTSESSNTYTTDSSEIINEENVDDPDQENEDSSYKWNTPCVLFLLETYRKFESKFNNGKQSHKKTWFEGSEILKSNGYTVIGPQCAAELRSLKKSYKSVKDHNKKSRYSKRSWQVYEIMDEIFSQKAWCAPVAVASSTGMSLSEVTKTDSDGDSVSEPSRSKVNSTALLVKRLHEKNSLRSQRPRDTTSEWKWMRNFLKL